VLRGDQMPGKSRIQGGFQTVIDFSPFLDTVNMNGEVGVMFEVMGDMASYRRDLVQGTKMHRFCSIRDIHILRPSRKMSNYCKNSVYLEIFHLPAMFTISHVSAWNFFM